jgi:hypothetical protein
MEYGEMKNRTFARVAGAAAVLFATAACDNPVEHDHGHLEARGVAITDLAGATIAETHGDHWDFASGSDLHLHPGEELEVRVWFVDPDGDRFQLGDRDDYELVVIVEDEAVASYGGHGDHGHFEAGAAGETTAVVHLWHGRHPAGHPDYSSPPLAIEVVDHGHGEH